MYVALNGDVEEGQDPCEHRYDMLRMNIIHVSLDLNQFIQHLLYNFIAQLSYYIYT